MLFVEILRLIFVALGIAVGLNIGTHLHGAETSKEISIIIGVLVGYLIGGVVGRLIERSTGVVARKISDMSPAELLAGAILASSGVIVAAVAGTPLIIFISPIIAYPIVLVIAWILAYVGFRVGIMKGSEIVSSLGLMRKLAPGTGPVDEKAVLFDSSAVMERSFWVLARNRLFPGDLIVPQFVLEELGNQLNSNDEASAIRARRALETLDALREDGAPLVVAEEMVPESDNIEGKVLILAQKLKARLATCSSRVVSKCNAMGIAVVDLRKLALEFVPEYSAGDLISVSLIRSGAQAGQAIGYLPDGDMVVVNDSSHLIGKGPVPVEVISCKRTSQGVLVFANLARN